MSKKLEKLADEMINLSPEEGQKLALITGFTTAAKPSSSTTNGNDG
jgi:hypothetical protein